MQLFGAFAFGLVLGWFAYFTNRYRSAAVQLGDLTSVVGILGGGAVLSLFPSGTDLFGSYAIGLCLGFFAYFFTLIILVGKSGNFNWDWFLDGRRTLPDGQVIIPGDVRGTVAPFGGTSNPSATDTIIPLAGQNTKA